jgi:hypothetical protein
MERQWVTYAEQRPLQTGVYEWKMPSVAVEGMTVIVAAHMRKRGAGYKDTISPTFDYWDGYRVSVPAGLQWRETDGYSDIKDYDVRIIGIEGVAFNGCIYCGSRPLLKAVQQAKYGGGVIVCGAPQHYNSWWLECCQWGRTPHLSDPRELERVRRAAIDRAKEMF